VNALNITGQSLYSADELVALTGFKPGVELTLTDLRGMATRISDHYHRHGYFVAQAYLPPQDIKDGAVTIAVSEGRYGNVTLNNTSSLSNGLADGLLTGLNPGDPIYIAPLETRLLLLSDVPGVTVRSTLVPGASVGASDLIVDVAPGRRVTGSIDFDNAGNRYTGENRIGSTVNLNNLAGRGDVLSLRTVTSGDGLSYGRGSYQMQFGRATAGVAYSYLRYELGKEFERLDAHGTARVASVYGSYPLIRSRNSTLYALAGFDAKTFVDEVDVTSSRVDKNAKVGFGGLYGFHRDTWGGGGLTNYAVTLSAGDIDIRTPVALAIDAATARTNGSFSKLSGSAARLQRVTDKLSLYAAINGQIASKNLDISEKMTPGGAYGVRAYPSGEAFADEGYVASLEARYALPRFVQGMPGLVQLIGFVDTSTVTLNKEPWASGDNRRTLSGAGVGLAWTDYNNFVVKAYYAFKLGSAPATSAPDRSGRFGILAVKFF
jgi:hemolysin activation/secretion protein